MLKGFINASNRLQNAAGSLFTLIAVLTVVIGFVRIANTDPTFAQVATPGDADADGLVTFNDQVSVNANWLRDYRDPGPKTRAVVWLQIGGTKAVRDYFVGSVGWGLGEIGYPRWLAEGPVPKLAERMGPDDELWLWCPGDLQPKTVSNPWEIRIDQLSNDGCIPNLRNNFVEAWRTVTDRIKVVAYIGPIDSAESLAGQWETLIMLDRAGFYGVCFDACTQEALIGRGGIDLVARFDAMALTVRSWGMHVWTEHMDRRYPWLAHENDWNNHRDRLGDSAHPNGIVLLKSTLDVIDRDWRGFSRQLRKDGYAPAIAASWILDMKPGETLDDVLGE